MRTTTLWIATLAMSSATALGCGSASVGEDTTGDTADARDEGGGADGDADAGGDTDADAEPDVAEDVPTDGSETAGDVPTDADPDGPAETGDVNTDVPADVPGETTTHLAVTMTGAETWADMMPGGPPSGHVLFGLHLDNGGTTDVTGFRVVDAAVDLASTGTNVFTATAPSVTLVGGGAFAGAVAAGTTVDLSGNGRSSSLAGSHCGAEVKVSANVTWDGGPAVNVGGPTVTLECVY